MLLKDRSVAKLQQHQSPTTPTTPYICTFTVYYSSYNYYNYPLYSCTFTVSCNKKGRTFTFPSPSAWATLEDINELLLFIGFDG